MIHSTMHLEGYFSRHPSNPEVGVLRTMWEYRDSQTPSILDEHLRNEVEKVLSRVQLLPIDPNSV